MRPLRIVNKGEWKRGVPVGEHFSGDSGIFFNWICFEKQLRCLAFRRNSLLPRTNYYTVSYKKVSDLFF